MQTAARTADVRTAGRRADRLQLTLELRGDLAGALLHTVPHGHAFEATAQIIAMNQGFDGPQRLLPPLHDTAGRVTAPTETRSASRETGA